MKKNAKSALALALAIAGAFAAPLCSDAAIDSIAPTTVQSVVASNEARAEKGLAFVLDVLAGWRGESAFASAEVQDHGEGAAGDCEWVGYSTTLYSTKGVRPFCLTKMTAVGVFGNCWYSHVIDFFNPLSDINDVLDLIDELTDENGDDETCH